MRFEDQPWTQWRPNGLPCSFDSTTTENNFNHLVNVFGKAWLTSQVGSGVADHAMISEWKNDGPQSYIAINSLADDLLILESVPGLQSVVHDLKQPDNYSPTRHMLRSAALIARSGTSILQLFESSNESVPDFLISVQDRKIPVEAKQLTSSKVSKQFQDFADLLMPKIRSRLADGVHHPHIYIVIKEVEDLPNIDVLLSVINEGILCRPDGHSLEHRSELFNIFIDHKEPNPGFSSNKTIYILCPRSSRENMRVIASLAKANKQLGSYTKNREGGLLCLGITDKQEPSKIAQFIYNKMNGRRFRNVSDVAILQSYVSIVEPLYSTMDLISFVRHPHAHFIIPDISFTWPGLGGDLYEVRPPSVDLTAYRYSSAGGQATFTGGDMLLYLDDIRSLTPEMLA